LKSTHFKKGFIEKVDAFSFEQFIVQSLLRIQPENIKFIKLGILIRDQAPFMMRAGQDLQAIFAIMKHIPYIANALNFVCEKIDEEK